MNINKRRGGAALALLGVVLTATLATICGLPKAAKAAGTTDTVWHSSLVVKCDDKDVEEQPEFAIERTVTEGQSVDIKTTVSTVRTGGEAVVIQPNANVSTGGVRGYGDLKPGENKEFTITANSNQNLPVGEHQLYVIFMPQGDGKFTADGVTYQPRVGIPLMIKLKVIAAQSAPVAGDQPQGSGPSINEPPASTTPSSSSPKSTLTVSHNGKDIRESSYKVDLGTERSVTVTLTSSREGGEDVVMRPSNGVSLADGTDTTVHLNKNDSTNVTFNVSSDAKSPYVLFMPQGTVGGAKVGITLYLAMTPQQEPAEPEPEVVTPTKDAALKVASGSYTYDGTGHPAIVSTASTGAQTVTYTDAEGNTSADAPVNAGAYTVKVEQAEADGFKAATASGDVVVTPRIVNPVAAADAIQNRPYDGTNNVAVDASKLTISQVVEGDDVKLVAKNATASVASPNVGSYNAVIDCGNATLEGAKAANYALATSTLTMPVDITKAPATITFKDDLSKTYGETFTFDKDSYTVDGVLASDLTSIQLTSAGAPAYASVGSYDISAIGAGANYDLKVNDGDVLRVKKATPEFVSASAGSGKEGSALSSVSAPTAAYVNPNIEEPVAGTTQWEAPDQKVGATDAYGYTFTPNDLANYEVVSGEVEVSAVPKDPVSLTATRTAFTYDGKPHEVSAMSDVDDATITVIYKVDGQETTTPPINAGKYDYKITADVPSSSTYADNEISGTLTISPIIPTGEPTVSGEGATLASYKLDGSGVVGIDGKSVSGTVSWNDNSLAVKTGDKYAWTFSSSDPNYNDTAGTIIPKLVETAAPVQKADLKELLIEATQTLASAQVSSNGAEVDPASEWVTNTVNDVLLGAITSANDTLVEGGATQTMIDEASVGLNAAIDSFELSAQPGLKDTNAEPVQKEESTVEVEQDRFMDVAPTDDTFSVAVAGEGNGQLFAFSDNDDVAYVTAVGNEIIVDPVSQGTAVVTVAKSATESFDQTATHIGVVVGEAPQGYVPPTDTAVDTTPEATQAAPEPTIRIYNPYNGEHLYVSQTEANNLQSLGWQHEDGAVTATADTSSTPVYRLYNPYTFEHHYTVDENEYNELEELGWQGEDIQFWSDDAQSVTVHRLFNPYSDGIGAHHYTANENEVKDLVAQGWKAEDVAWYYVAIAA